MAKSQNKTIATKLSVSEYVAGIADPQQKKETQELIDMMSAVTGEPPVIWGGSIIGFGSYHYKYESGREGDFMKTGFSARKNNFSIYIMPGMQKYPDLMQKLGIYKTGKSCLYLKNLSQVDRNILKELVDRSYRDMTKKYA
jgi:hypothetical protein